MSRRGVVASEEGSDDALGVVQTPLHARLRADAVVGDAGAWGLLWVS